MLGEKLAPWSQVLRALGGLLEGEQHAARTGLVGFGWADLFVT